MFCPKCGEIELEAVKQDKLEYLACTNSCEGVWISREDLVIYWGKKRVKSLESQMVETKQPQFSEDAGGSEAPLPTGEEASEFSDSDDDDDDDDDDGMGDFDDDDDWGDDDEDDDFDEGEEELDDHEVEEVHFGDQRDRGLTFINEDPDFEDAPAGGESSEGFNESADLLDEEEEDNIQIVEEENFFWTSPFSGSPMKRFTLSLKDKHKCFVGYCPDSDHYWVDGNEELTNHLLDLKRGAPRNFADLLAYDRPEIEIPEDDEDDEDEV